MSEIILSETAQERWEQLSPAMRETLLIEFEILIDEFAAGREEHDR
jgi:hypothetical protein